MARAKKQRVFIEGTNSSLPIPQFDLSGKITGYAVPEGFWSDDVEAIVNANSGEFVQTVTPAYEILQHQKYGGIVVEELRASGYDDVSGSIIEQNDGSNMRIRIIFRNVYIEEPGIGRNIGVGGEFSNSFDSKYAARGCAYFLRISCTNQMVLKNVIPETVFARNHVADDPAELEEAVTVGIGNFIKNLIGSGAKFEKVMNESMTDDIRIQNSDQLVEAMMAIFKIRSHAEAIAEKAWEAAVKPYRGSDFWTIDRWELYQAACAYCSHADLSPPVQDLIMYRAENNILARPLKMNSFLQLKT